MSVTNCLGNGMYLVEDEDGFEVHVFLTKDLFSHSSQLKDMVNCQLSGTGIHACMTNYQDKEMIHFQSSAFLKWDKKIADLVIDAVKTSLPEFKQKIHLQKAVRVLREEYNLYFNICTDFDKALKKIEELRAVLHS